MHLPEPFFDTMRTGQDHITVGKCYHWVDPAYTDFNPQQLHNRKMLHVCDEPWSWAHHESTLYELDCCFRQPLVLLEQFEEFERMFVDPSPEWSLVVEGEFDSVVYTPHPYGRGYRQALLRYPSHQVIGHRKVAAHEIDWDLIRQKRLKLGENWTRILFKPGCPYTPEQLQELELRAMAYRYAYYVLAAPLITDSDYDQLDQAILPWVSATSPLKKPGSDWEPGYTREQIDYAAKLRRGEVTLQPYTTP